MLLDVTNYAYNYAHSDYLILHRRVHPLRNSNKKPLSEWLFHITSGVTFQGSGVLRRSPDEPPDGSFSLNLGRFVRLEQPSDVEVSSELILPYHAFAYFSLSCLRQLKQRYDRILFMFGLAAANATIVPYCREHYLTTMDIEPVSLAS